MATNLHMNIPTFDNTVSSYLEFRKRAMLFQARMRLEGRDKVKQTALLLLGQLTGIAWETCESLADDPAALEAEEAFDKLIALLDSRFRHDRSTELPDAFEEYFYR